MSRRIIQFHRHRHGLHILSEMTDVLFQNLLLNSSWPKDVGVQFIWFLYVFTEKFEFWECNKDLFICQFDQVCFHHKETVRPSRSLMININIISLIHFTFRMCTIKLFYQQLGLKLFKMDSSLLQPSYRHYCPFFIIFHYIVSLPSTV